MNASLTRFSESLRIRPRRNRRAAWLRKMTQENVLAPCDLVWPIFVHEGKEPKICIAAMPGVARLSENAALAAAEQALSLKIPAIALFPYVNLEKRDRNGAEALNPENILCRVCLKIKKAFPELGVITDVALDAYASHGHDGLVQNGRVLNDETVEILCQQAVLHAQCGADVVAPSDMMDGRIGAIRNALDQAGYSETGVLSYAVKYASAFYAPFRDAVGSQRLLSGDKKTYQMNPANAVEALREAALDAQEGADMLMIKPGLPYLDVLYRIKAETHLPTLAYQVSGEYSMILAASEKGWLSREDAILESLIGFKRAGADAIFTYFAPEAAALLKDAA